MVHQKNTWIKEFKVEELKKMWEPGAKGKVTTWNQVNSAWPNAPLKLFGPGADSGTFDYFTDAINGKEKASRGDFTASEDDNVLVQGVSRDVGAIGYFGMAYYVENKDKLKAVPMSQRRATRPSCPARHRDGWHLPAARPIFIYVAEGHDQPRSRVRDLLPEQHGQADQASRVVPSPRRTMIRR